jgi:glutamine synthetase
MDCNPYLAIAASLSCGLLGMLEKRQPRACLTSDAYSLPHDIPRDLSRALELFNDIPDIEELLGPDFCALYRAVKMQESDAYLQVISPWEREHLLLNV